MLPAEPPPIAASPPSSGLPISSSSQQNLLRSRHLPSQRNLLRSRCLPPSSSLPILLPSSSRAAGRPPLCRSIHPHSGPWPVVAPPGASAYAAPTLLCAAGAYRTAACACLPPLRPAPCLSTALCAVRHRIDDIFVGFVKGMLKAPDHQVAGHQARVGQLGPLVDDSGHFYKPLQDGGRGSKELSFYCSFSSDPRVPKHIHRFFPTFHGTQIVEASDGSGLCAHLVLEDIVSDLKHPSVADIKIGSRTWYPHASEDYIAKCTKKDSESTSLLLGFRISGLQVYEGKDFAFWKPSKKHVQSFTTEDVRLVLRKFVSSNPSSNSEPDCAFASVVYGGSDGILAQLLELKAWFDDQTIFHFHSVSVLMVYENDTAVSGQLIANVKLVDFAHVFEGDGVIDHNFLGGLCSLIKFISEILAGFSAYGADSQVQESKKNQFCFENGGQE